MTRTQYQRARRQIRDNGLYALKWMDEKTREVMERVMDEHKAQDALAERADIVAYCQRIGTYCTPLHTADLGLLARFQSRNRA